ncbi:M6 family metalloprotease domain-containing protein [Macrococcus hajekii]|uniref:M6 family metalloprotease domain-containing protein n=1 Tax=Macrococcus hajekii TaxID=198482 RepID=A0A4R6BIR1_9STAP|nr:immune inhibitor A domain-containing protein [Macrococcus hajekii]TDM01539.1 M6 family metalloprotease domain-containing protein [Macrococcus hajekii]GGB00852.1 immune inhibitor A [Macrococcus hajekii]
MKKKVISSVLTLGLGLSLTAGTSYAHNNEYEKGSNFDGVIANEERLIKMLKQEGILAKDASRSEAEKAVKEYVRAKGDAATRKVQNEGKFIKKHKKVTDKNNNGSDNKYTRGNGKKKGHANVLKPVTPEAYTGETRTDKVLLLAIDFPDYKNSSITKDESDMFYENYPMDHFQQMVFGENGYKGPNGQNLISMKQYYQNQSGGSYDIDGQVHGWYTADHPAAYYGGNYPDADGSDSRPKELIKEALEKAAKDPSLNLADYDQWDRYDLDGDGVLNEKDGIVDHLMIIHAGPGEEAGGGLLTTDAIWSHRWSLDFNEQGEPYTIPGTKSGQEQFGGELGVIDYTIQPEDGATGVFAHEFGHDLGLPDEYDTIYSGKGEPVSFWSIMSSGSWAGKIPGTEPTGFDAYMKEMLQDFHGGNWQTGSEIDAKEVTSTPQLFTLDEATTKGTNDDAVKITLPDKVTEVVKPAQGTKTYFSGSGDDLLNTMTASVDLTGKKSAELTFKAWYDIEKGFDYAYVQASTDGENWTNLAGNITNNDDPEGSGANAGNGIDGTSNGWIDAKFDLSAYAGKKVQFRYLYVTDGGYTAPGLYADDIKVTADGASVFADDAEGTSKFDMNGFSVSDGKKYSKNYYLLQWRSHNKIDVGLAHIKRGDNLLSFNKGLNVFYVDESYTDNHVGRHPGYGYIGIVDADQNALKWTGATPSFASTQYQVRDAAFSLTPQDPLNFKLEDGSVLVDKNLKANPLFSDTNDYSNADQPHAGKILPQYGLKVKVVAESKDKSVGKVMVYK